MINLVIASEAKQSPKNNEIFSKIALGFALAMTELLKNKLKRGKSDKM
jgi:hypothetical protein